MLKRKYLFLSLAIAQMSAFGSSAFAAALNGRELREPVPVAAREVISTPEANNDSRGMSSGRGTEWRLLGPAFSKHSNTFDAPVISPSKVITNCGFTGQDYCRDVLVPGAQRWSQNNPAIGLEWSRPTDEGSTGRDRLFGTFVRDSFGKMSFMASAARTYEIAQVGSINVQAGLGAGLWYRTVITGTHVTKDFTSCSKASEFSRTICPGDAAFGEFARFQTPSPKYQINGVINAKTAYRLVPFVLPLVSITDSKTGLGLNISVLPKLKIGRYQASSATTAFFQLSYLF